jgi:2,3-bisphosphoglycerate-dependent phosphoglycerate mutase
MSHSVWLARHAQTGANAEGRYVGSSDVDLDEAGLAQAQQVASWAKTARIDAIVSSPARRAWRTASLVGTQLGIEPRVDERLRELDFGIAEGRTLTELREADPQVVAEFELDPVACHMPGGEHPCEALRRMRSAIADVLRMDTSRPLVVTHNSVLRLLVCDVLHVPLKDYRRVLPIAEHCAITELSMDDGTLALRRFNAPPVAP